MFVLILKCIVSLVTQADADGATDIRDLDRLLPALASSAVPVRGAPSAFAADGNGNGPSAGHTENIGEKLGMVVGSRCAQYACIDTAVQFVCRSLIHTTL